MEINKYTILHSALLKDALIKIEENHNGIVFVVDETGKMLGVATDGDIRRKLLNGFVLTDPINLCMNRNFVWERTNVLREVLLKKLDQRVRAIPLLDDEMRLVSVVSRDYMPLVGEEPIYLRSTAPARISFAGGGSDLTHYFGNDDGAVINATISLYSHALLRIRSDTVIRIVSRDLGITFESNNLDEAMKNFPNDLGLIISLLKLVKPDFGFELYLHSDFPIRSGLGGSAVISAAVLGCFNLLRRDRWNDREIAEIAYQAERHCLGVSGGWQDQYATVFGGFNFMEFNCKRNMIYPLRIDKNTLLELEECLILCDTKTVHDSGSIHDDQNQRTLEANVRNLVNSNVDLSYQIRNALLCNDLNEFGTLLDKAWTVKQQFSPLISTDHLSQIYDGAMANGATGGKLLGAGGGGFFLFFANPCRKHELFSYIDRIGLRVCPFRFEHNGLESWVVRDCKN